MVGDRQDGAATAAPSDKKLGKITSTKMGSIYPTLTHEEHDHLLEWCGGSSDPAAFDLVLANQRLSEVKF